MEIEDEAEAPVRVENSQLGGTRDSFVDRVKWECTVNSIEYSEIHGRITYVGTNHVCIEVPFTHLY